MKKFARSLEYLQKVKDEVEFLHEDKNQHRLQIDPVIFVGCGQACSKLRQHNKFSACF